MLNSAPPDDSEFKAPPFYDKLSVEDQLGYQTLQNEVGAPTNRYKRNRRLVTLQDSFDRIKEWCIRGQIDDPTRCLVCGVVSLRDGVIGMNTRQLCVLLMKSKSCLNGALALMKFLPLPAGENEDEALFQAIPYLRSHYVEFRQWTVRRVRAFEASSIPLMEDELVPVDPDFEWDIPVVSSEWNDPEWLATGQLALSVLFSQMAGSSPVMGCEWEFGFL
jgi:hypothetical protein